MEKTYNRDKFYNMFLDGLRDIYSAEQQIVESIPKMIKAATTQELKNAFKKHLEETKMQVQRLQQVFAELNESPEGEFCEGIQGLIKECEEIIQRKDPNFVEDAALIAAAQKIEHYEIASYGSLRTFAGHLELDNVEDILQEILDEEGKTNKELTTLAEGGWLTSGINAQAVNK